MLSAVIGTHIGAENPQSIPLLHTLRLVAEMLGTWSIYDVEMS